MIDIIHLINFLPFRYKDEDSYKDKEGKGLLEKFLEVCGNYFQKVKTQIDNATDIIDVEKTSDQYLYYLWQLFGQLPLAGIPNTEPLNLTQEQRRTLVKYGISFLKIRGTKEFFEILFRVYHNDTNNLKLNSITYKNPSWVKGIKNSNDPKIWDYFDEGTFDSSTTFDERFDIEQCVEATFDITGTFKDEALAGKSLRTFIEKYVPYNVKPIVKLNGKILEVSKDIKVEVWQLNKQYPQGTWIESAGSVLNEGDNLRVRVTLLNKDTQEGISGEILSWVNNSVSSKHDSPYEFTIHTMVNNQGDTYHFSSGDVKKDLSISYKTKPKDVYSLTIDKSQAELTPKLTEISVTLKGTLNGVGTPILCEQTNERKYAADGITHWTFKEKGSYSFILVANSSYRVTLNITQKTAAYTVYLRCFSKKVHGSSTHSSEASALFDINIFDDTQWQATSPDKPLTIRVSNPEYLNLTSDKDYYFFILIGKEGEDKLSGYQVINGKAIYSKPRHYKIKGGISTYNDRWTPPFVYKNPQEPGYQLYFGNSNQSIPSLGTFEFIPVDDNGVEIPNSQHGYLHIVNAQLVLKLTRGLKINNDITNDTLARIDILLSSTTTEGQILIKEHREIWQIKDPRGGLHKISSSTSQGTFKDSSNNTYTYQFISSASGSTTELILDTYVPGIYTFDLDNNVDVDNQVGDIQVYDNRIYVEDTNPTQLIIQGDSGDSHWEGLRTSKATYKVDDTSVGLQVKFNLGGITKKGTLTNLADSNNSLTCNGKTIKVDEAISGITLTELGTYEYIYNYTDTEGNEKTLKAILEITIPLEVEPNELNWAGDMDISTKELSIKAPDKISWEVELQ